MINKEKYTGPVSPQRTQLAADEKRTRCGPL